jgi:uncharacterized protein YutE (UPF0331/DUF86 family)
MTHDERMASKFRAIERHLARVESMVPDDRAAFEPMTAASDAVVLHLWQAIQLAIDLALHECSRRRLETPPDDGSAFRALGGAGVLDRELAERLVRAVAFRNVIAHGYEGLDLDLVWRAGREGPADLRAFMRAVAETP